MRAYLVDEFGFDHRGIDVEGRGEEELLDAAMTEAAHFARLSFRGGSAVA